MAVNWLFYKVLKKPRHHSDDIPGEYCLFKSHISEQKSAGAIVGCLSSPDSLCTVGKYLCIPLGIQIFVSRDLILRLTCNVCRCFL